MTSALLRRSSPVILSVQSVYEYSLMCGNSVLLHVFTSYCTIVTSCPNASWVLTRPLLSAKGDVKPEQPGWAEHLRMSAHWRKLLHWPPRPAPVGYLRICHRLGSASHGRSTSASHQTALNAPLHAKHKTR